jgi:hypothetical protein
MATDSDTHQRTAVLEMDLQHLPVGKRLLPLRLGQAGQPGMRIISAIRGGRHPSSIPAPGSRRAQGHCSGTLDLEQVSRHGRPDPGTTRRPFRKSFRKLRSTMNERFAAAVAYLPEEPPGSRVRDHGRRTGGACRTAERLFTPKAPTAPQEAGPAARTLEGASVINAINSYFTRARTGGSTP